MSNADSIIERRYPYGAATIIERIPKTESGDDYELLDDLIFRTADGVEVSAFSIANPSGLRIAIERNDLINKQESGYYVLVSHVVSMPRMMHFPRELHEDGLFHPDNLDEYPLWSRPGDWLLLLHEISHAVVACANLQRYVENQAYRDRVLAFHKALAGGEVIGVLADYEEYIARVIREERDAWAYALRILRAFRKMGIDFEPSLPGTRDLETIVHTRIGSYVVKMLQMMDEEENLATYVEGVNKALRGDPTSKLKHNNEYLFAGR